MIHRLTSLASASHAAMGSACLRPVMYTATRRRPCQRFGPDRRHCIRERSQDRRACLSVLTAFLVCRITTDRTVQRCAWIFKLNARRKGQGSLLRGFLEIFANVFDGALFLYRGRAENDLAGLAKRVVCLRPRRPRSMRSFGPTSTLFEAYDLYLMGGSAYAQGGSVIFFGDKSR
jgi:hypothetical protein